MKTIEINESAFEIIDRIAKHTGFPVVLIASSMILRGSGTAKASDSSNPPPAPFAAVSRTFHAPATVMKDFRSFAANQRANSFGEAFRANPEMMALSIITRNVEEHPGRPLNRRINSLPSNKGILDRCRKAMKSGPVESVSLRIDRKLWERIEFACETYNLTPDDWFLCAVGYYAALWQERQEKLPPKSPFERFERGLATDSRRERVGAKSSGRMKQ